MIFDTKKIDSRMIRPAIAIRPFHISACGVNPLFQELSSFELAALVDSFKSFSFFKDIINKTID